jgi:opacity protein-like surface antigen
MFLRKKRLLLLSSSAIMLLCLAGIATSQAPTEPPASPGTTPPETTTTPATPPEGAKPATPPASPPATPQQPGQGGVVLPPVTVTPPVEKPKPKPVEQITREPPSTSEPPRRQVERPATPRIAADQGAQIAAQTATFNERRDNIFAPLGTAPTTMSREAIESLPQGTNSTVDKVLLQLPGVSQDSAASGNLHVRNEHANVSYRINGILLPDGLGGFGQYLDPAFIGSLTLITGALPAQYGLRTAGIVDIQTASGAFNNAGQIGFYGGSRETKNYNVQYGGRTGSTEYFFTGRYLQNILGIENPLPTLNAIHDRTEQDRSFAYVSTIIDPWTRVSFIGGIANNRFQIPDRPGVPPSFTAFGNAMFDSSKLNENQIEHYKFAVVALQKSVNDVDFQLAYFNRASTVHYLPDPLGDLMFNGVASDVYRASVVNGIQADSAFRLNPAHTLRVGLYGSAERTNVANAYQLLPLDNNTGGQLVGVPDVPFGANDTSALLGWLGSAYVSDEWKITDALTLNSGLRFDQTWQYQTANQLSPRFSLTYSPIDTTTFHAGYARFFTPPVQVIAAPSNTNLFTSCLNIPTCTTILAPSVPPPYHPMLPERASVYDIGVTQKVLPGLELGADIYLKQTRDLIDDGQFGAALVLNGFNYEKAENVGVELKALYSNGNFRAYANWAWANQRATNIITNQYLFDPARIAFTASNWIYTDHSQVYTASGGVSYLWNGTRWSADLIYGSGLRAGFANTDHNASYAQVNTGLSREVAIPGWAPVVLRFDVINLFDTSYAIRNGTGIGVFAPQYGPRRAYYFGIAQKFGPGVNDSKPIGAVYRPGYGGRLMGEPPRGLDGSIYATPWQAIWTWTGLYIGANAGRAWGRFSTDTVFTDATLGVPVGPVLSDSNSSSRLNRGFVGGTTGYNWQWGAWLAGLETDVQFSHQRAPTSAACAPAICNPDLIGLDTLVTTNVSHNLDWFGTLRGRVGALIAADALVYATGGLAFGEIEHIGVISPISIGNDYFVSRSMRAGWAAGGGIEARLGGNVTGKVEYLHMDFGRYSALASNIGNVDPVNVSFNSHISEHLLRLGLNYKFDPVAVYATAYAPERRLTPAKLDTPRWVAKSARGAVWTWTGFYFGANAGYAASKLNNDTFAYDGNLGTPLFATGSGSLVKGALGGMQTGYNWQAGILVGGVETDVQMSMQRVHSTSDCPAAICSPMITNFEAPVRLDHTYSLDWFGTVRMRLGAAVTPDVMPYVTGGFAAAGIAHFGNIAGFAFGGFDVNGNPIFNPAGQDFATRVVKPGWALGGGIETRLFGNVTGKIEYLHMDFGNQTSMVANPNNTVPVAVTFNSRLKDDIVRLGLNYKFDPNLIQVPATDVTKTWKGLADVHVLKRLAANVPWSWTGYYLGLNAGYSWGNTKTDTFFSDETMGGLLYTTSSRSRIGGKLGGAQTGYNWQLGPWVWGVEADAQLADQRGTPIIRCPDMICNPIGPTIVQFDQYQKIEWFSTLRARFGAALTPDALLYVTGGAAIGEIQMSGNVNTVGIDQNGNAFIIPNQFSAITINRGWTLGGGLEARLCGNLTGRIEYLYLDLGANHAIANNQQLTTLTTQFGSRVTDQLVRAGINYKFD